MSFVGMINALLALLATVLLLPTIGVFRLKRGNLFVVKLLFVMSFVGMINVSLFQSYVTFIALQSKDLYPPLYLPLIIPGRRTNVCCLCMPVSSALLLAIQIETVD